MRSLYQPVLRVVRGYSPSGLKIKATETEPAKQFTPAMKQGLADRRWTVLDLLMPKNKTL